jgi:hypothetical protein
MTSYKDLFDYLYILAEKTEVSEEFKQQWAQDVKTIEDMVVECHEIHLPKIEPNLKWEYKRKYQHIYKHLK